MQNLSNAGPKGREGARGQTHKIERLDLSGIVHYFLLAIFVSVFGCTDCVPKTTLCWHILNPIDSVLDISTSDQLSQSRYYG